jgi:hypothetical protein
MIKIEDNKEKHMEYLPKMTIQWSLESQHHLQALWWW